MEQANNVVLMENEHVQAFLALMRENSTPNMPDMLAVFQQIGAMEKQLDAAVTELSAMRKELSEAQKQAHPVKNAMRDTVKSMEKNADTLRQRLSELKQNIIDGCKTAVAAFKEKGVAALDNVARFFHVRPALEAIGRSLDSAIADDNRNIARIETMSREYHEAGLHLKNMGRAILGKDAATEAKPIGKIANAFIAPVRRECAMFASMKSGVNKALAAVGRLEQAAERSRPSIKDTLQELNTQIAAKSKTVKVSVRKAEHDNR